MHTCRTIVELRYPYLFLHFAIFHAVNLDFVSISIAREKCQKWNRYKIEYISLPDGFSLWKFYGEFFFSMFTYSFSLILVFFCRIIEKRFGISWKCTHINTNTYVYNIKDEKKNINSTFECVDFCSEQHLRRMSCVCVCFHFRSKLTNKVSNALAN